MEDDNNPHPQAVYVVSMLKGSFTVSESVVACVSKRAEIEFEFIT